MTPSFRDAPCLVTKVPDPERARIKPASLSLSNTLTAVSRDIPNLLPAPITLGNEVVAEYFPLKISLLRVSNAFWYFNSLIPINLVI